MQRFLRTSVATVLLGVVFFYPLAAPTHHRIDEEHFKLFRTGMTVAEVEAVFGAPPGVYDWVIAGDENPGWTTVFVDPQPVSNIRIPIQWQRDTTRKVCISRHAVFVIPVDHRNRVTSLPPSLGRPMTERPWKRWWRMLSTK